jgi:transcriptional regulator with XRE-family HTH domain
MPLAQDSWQSAHVKYRVQRLTRTADAPELALEWSASLTAPMGIFAGASGKILPMSWKTLGDAVRHRRKELGLTQADVTARGGPSVETVRAIENNRAGRLGRQSRRALERAIEWDVGTIDAVLEGAAPRVLGTATGASAPPPAPATGREATSAAAERFAMAERLIKMRQAFTNHRDHMTETARVAMEEEFTAAAREIEEAMVWTLPWLGDEERAAAIRILAELRSD